MVILGSVGRVLVLVGLSLGISWSSEVTAARAGGEAQSVIVETTYGDLVGVSLDEEGKAIIELTPGLADDEVIFQDTWSNQRFKKLMWFTSAKQRQLILLQDVNDDIYEVRIDMEKIFEPQSKKSWLRMLKPKPRRITVAVELFHFKTPNFAAGVPGRIPQDIFGHRWPVEQMIHFYLDHRDESCSGLIRGAKI